jgi:mono/diheme cytochrome c family protein
MRSCLPRFTAATVLVLAAFSSFVRTAPPTAAEQVNFFEQEVQPILQAQCLSCHGPEKKVRGGLRLTSREELLKGGDTGPAISVEKPEDSLFLKAIHHQDLKMPPKGKLPQAQLDILTKWVKLGAPWSATVAKHHGPPPVDDRARNFWSFKPVVRPAPPTVKDAGWVKTPIDAFVLAKLEAAGLTPAAPAEKLALLRRVTYDLTGLPPTLAEVEAALADNSGDWYEKTIDRLLASPAYGERWARHWLDLVRYAESNSFERDGTKPNVWRYRDYVIRAFNNDMPYDQFIREQLAGDELDRVTTDTLIATGYYRLGPWDDEPVDATQALYDDLDDVVSTTGQVFLGLTVGCARCHDHKIDPFPQKDYYRLLGFFHGFKRYGVRSHESVVAASLRSIASDDEQQQQKEQVAAHQKKIAVVNASLKTIEDEVQPKLQGGERDDFKYEQNRLAILKKNTPALVKQETFDRYAALRKERDKLERTKPTSLAMALCITEEGPKARDTFVLMRGNATAKGERVEPGFPQVLGGGTPELPKPAVTAKTAGRRRVLADWLGSPANPLTARVMVNRLWQHHFGRGLVRSSNDYGYRGTPPTHPELLDWLASEFVARGWKLKEMHRLILTSNAYRLSSQPNPTAQAKDAENDLLWRFEPRRLGAEEVRDSILAVSGNLNPKMGGPSIHPTIPKEVLAGQSNPGTNWDLLCPPDERARRSVYVHIKRSLGVPILTAFDAADTDGSCAGPGHAEWRFRQRAGQGLRQSTAPAVGRRRQRPSPAGLAPSHAARTQRQGNRARRALPGQDADDSSAVARRIPEVLLSIGAELERVHLPRLTRRSQLRTETP